MIVILGIIEINVHTHSAFVFASVYQGSFSHNMHSTLKNVVPVPLRTESKVTGKVSTVISNPNEKHESE